MRIIQLVGADGKRRCRGPCRNATAWNPAGPGFTARQIHQRRPQCENGVGPPHPQAAPGVDHDEAAQPGAEPRREQVEAPGFIGRSQVDEDGAGFHERERSLHSFLARAVGIDDRRDLAVGADGHIVGRELVAAADVRQRRRGHPGIQPAQADLARHVRDQEGDVKAAGEEAGMQAPVAATTQGDRQLLAKGQCRSRCSRCTARCACSAATGSAPSTAACPSSPSGWPRRRARRPRNCASMPWFKAPKDQRGTQESRDPSSHAGRRHRPRPACD